MRQVDLPAFRPHLGRRQKLAAVWKILFLMSTLVGIVALAALLLSIVNDSFGVVALQFDIDPASLGQEGRPLKRLQPEELGEILTSRLSGGLIRRLESEKPLAERSREELYELVIERVAKLRVIASWPLAASLLQRGQILEWRAQNHPEAALRFRSWVSWRFLLAAQASVPEKAGVRTAVLGSLWMVLIVVVVAFPLGVGAAIYLEEYARENFFTRLLQLNIYNLAGVPSIIYGILGLAVFVRLLVGLTSGAAFAVGDSSTANGRTILSGGLTLALLVLPLVIINSQEAIRAVPRGLRYSSYALGATKWQTIWHHVLPGSLDRILTGTILAVSRAIGETAPLVVVGASTFVALDPSSIFSRFTTLPIQIYQWTARPQAEFRNVAAAAIIVLLVLLLAMNTAAILLRDRISRSRRE
ncbi:MAG: phosphate ABC transporter, permease protein PstA [Spirochaetes bacterium RBG_16_67_19]|nr:MAG: phosphate ABC transporter, permease protein PstA [Spirochaetes bacterium RBG_16_67_19]